MAYEIILFYNLHMPLFLVVVGIYIISMFSDLVFAPSFYLDLVKCEVTESIDKS